MNPISIQNSGLLLEIEPTSCGLSAYIDAHPDDARIVVATCMSPRYALRILSAFRRLSSERIKNCGPRALFVPARQVRDYLFENALPTRVISHTTEPSNIATM